MALRRENHRGHQRTGTGDQPTIAALRQIFSLHALQRRSFRLRM